MKHKIKDASFIIGIPMIVGAAIALFIPELNRLMVASLVVGILGFIILIGGMHID